MQKFNFSLLILVFLVFLLSCNKKKYTEVVEVPLPSAEEKITMGMPDDVAADAGGSFQLERLAFNYDALSPSISPLTLEMHYSKHYLTYTNNLNKAIAGTDLEGLTIEEVLSKLDTSIPEIKNNAGGYYNHSLYFKCLSPKSEKPRDSLATAINKKFGSFEEFTSAFKTEATKQFGSSWVWLIVDASGDLQITNTPNQDNPLMRNAVVKGKPILALDLWEHAYYMDYQYKRKLYVDAFFKVINWKKVNENYLAAIEK